MTIGEETGQSKRHPAFTIRRNSINRPGILTIEINERTRRMKSYGQGVRDGNGKVNQLPSLTEWARPSSEEI